MGLHLATGGHIVVLCIHYKNYTIIRLLGIPLIFFHVRPANQPTTMFMALCHKNLDTHGLAVRKQTLVSSYVIWQ
jgi:hypothetical protein